MRDHANRSETLELLRERISEDPLLHETQEFLKIANDLVQPEVVRDELVRVPYVNARPLSESCWRT